MLDMSIADARHEYCSQKEITTSFIDFIRISWVLRLKYNHLISLGLIIVGFYSSNKPILL